MWDTKRHKGTHLLHMDKHLVYAVIPSAYHSRTHFFLSHSRDVYEIMVDRSHDITHSQCVHLIFAIHNFYEHITFTQESLCSCRK